MKIVNLFSKFKLNLTFFIMYIAFSFVVNFIKMKKKWTESIIVSKKHNFSFKSVNFKVD